MKVVRVRFRVRIRFRVRVWFRVRVVGSLGLLYNSSIFVAWLAQSSSLLRVCIIKNINKIVIHYSPTIYM